jgi:hypothetical protein
MSGLAKVWDSRQFRDSRPGHTDREIATIKPSHEVEVDEAIRQFKNAGDGVPAVRVFQQIRENDDLFRRFLNRLEADQSEILETR